MCGELEISRDYCYCRKCRHNEAPLDDKLEMSGLPHKMTSGLMLETAYCGQNQHSFESAPEMMKRALQIDISKETVRKATEEIGKIVFESDKARANHIAKNMHEIEAEPEKTKGTLYAMTDGAAVNTRIKDDNGSTWRENKTVIAFTDINMIKRKDGGNIIVSKEYSAYIGTAESFRGYVLDTAIKAGYGKVRDAAIIGGGAAWIRNTGSGLFPEAVQILDLHHLKENIYTYAKHKFSNNEKAYAPWAEAFIDKAEKGNIQEALSLLPEEEKLPAGVVNLRTYILNNIDRIDYPKYKEKAISLEAEL